jgi:hypothetical protein
MDDVVRDQSHSNLREVLHFINYLFDIAVQLFYFFKINFKLIFIFLYYFDILILKINLINIYYFDVLKKYISKNNFYSLNRTLFFSTWTLIPHNF